MRTLLGAVIIALCCAPPATAGTLEELTPYFSTQHFTWKETFHGRRLLKEQGALFSAGVTVGALFSPSLVIRGRGEIFGGDVDYKGETQAPDSVPVNTTVFYLGTKAEADAGYRLMTGDVRLEPFGGIGYRWWLRDLDDTKTAAGDPVYGYTERWQVVYGRVGARAETPVGRARLVAQGGARRPIYAGNTVDFAGSGETTFHPKGRWRGFAETAVAYRNFNLAVLYEGFRFAQSDTKAVQGTNYLQPDSSSDIFGVRLGWTF